MASRKIVDLNDPDFNDVADETISYNLMKAKKITASVIKSAYGKEAPVILVPPPILEGKPGMKLGQLSLASKVVIPGRSQAITLDYSGLELFKKKLANF